MKLRTAKKHRTRSRVRARAALRRVLLDAHRRWSDDEARMGPIRENLRAGGLL